MPYGQHGNYDKVMFFSIRGKKDERPYFKVDVPKDVGGYDSLDPAHWIEGEPIKIVWTERPKYGQPDKMETYLRLSLLDVELIAGKHIRTMYVLEIPFNRIGRTIMNSIASLGKEYLLGKLKITLWRSKNKTTGEEYNSASVYWNGIKLDWKIPGEELKELISYVDTDSGKQAVYKNVNARLFEELRPVMQHLNEMINVPREPVVSHDEIQEPDFDDLDVPDEFEAPPPPVTKPVNKPKPQENEQDDLPF